MNYPQHTLVDHITLLLDSNKWYLEKVKTKNTAPFQEEIFCTAVICNAWSALEGYINHIASIAKFAKKLESYEGAFLEEMDWKLGENGKFEKHIAYHSTSKKFLFLLDRFSAVEIVKFKQSRLWNDMKVAEDKRNNLTHPKEKISYNDLNAKDAENIDKTARSAILLLRKKVLKSSYPRT